MFAVLCVEQKRDGIFGGILQRMRRRQVRSEQMTTPFGRYLAVTVTRAPPDWDKVARHAGRAAGRMVLPPGLEPPEDCEVARFIPEELTRRVLCDTAVRIIRQTKIPLYRKTVTLVDPKGRYGGFVRDLLCQCMTVKVYSADERGCAELSLRMMEELGAGIVYADDPALCENAMLVLAPDGTDAMPLKSKAPVFTADSPDLPCASTLVGEPRLKLPEELVPWVPAGIAPMDFAGALYAMGSWRGKGNLAAETMRCRERVLKIWEIAKYIEQIDEKNSVFHRNSAGEA